MSKTWEDRIIQQFPHCDSRVLHAPGECEFCDRHPEWQELRESWSINFTGHHVVANEYGGKYLPCPSEVNRPLSTINQWDGNVPFKGDRINTDSPVFPEGADVHHDPLSRYVSVGVPIEIDEQGNVHQVNSQRSFKVVADQHDADLAEEVDEIIDSLVSLLKRFLR